MAMCKGFMCDVQWYLHLEAYYPYSGVLQFAPWRHLRPLWVLIR